MIIIRKLCFHKFRMGKFGFAPHYESSHREEDRIGCSWESMHFTIKVENLGFKRVIAIDESNFAVLEGGHCQKIDKNIIL